MRSRGHARYAPIFLLGTHTRREDGLDLGVVSSEEGKEVADTMGAKGFFEIDPFGPIADVEREMAHIVQSAYEEADKYNKTLYSYTQRFGHKVNQKVIIPVATVLAPFVCCPLIPCLCCCAFDFCWAIYCPDLR